MTDMPIRDVPDDVIAALSVPDLIIAATAELAGLIVPHSDKGFDLIASVTGQPAEWLITLTTQLCQSKRMLAV